MDGWLKIDKEELRAHNVRMASTVHHPTHVMSRVTATVVLKGGIRIRNEKK